MTSVKSELYVQRYFKFIESRASLKREGPFELHHILPSSLGGSDDSTNLVPLTLREHFIAHRMLFRAYASEKLRRAFWMMSNRIGVKNSKDYAVARIAFAAESSARQKAWFEADESRKDVVSQALKERWQDSEFVERHKARSSSVMSDLNKDPTFQAKRKEALKPYYNGAGKVDACISNWNRYKDKWIKAQDFYETWVEAGRPVHPTLFCKAFGDTSSKWNYWQSFHKRFVVEGWIPKQDPTWANWSGVNDV